MINWDDVQLALRAQMLTASTLPTLVVEMERFTPSPGEEFMEEDFVPASGQVISMPANGGRIEASGLYVIRWYGAPGVGTQTIRDGCDRILAKLSPGWSTVTGNGDEVRIPTRQIPMPQQILRSPDGSFAVGTIRVPFIVSSTNAVAA